MSNIPQTGLQGLYLTSTGDGSDAVWTPLQSSGGGGAGITALTGDVTATGSGSVAAHVVKINGSPLGTTIGAQDKYVLSWDSTSSTWIPAPGGQGPQGYQGAQGAQGTKGSTYFGVSTTVLTLQTGAGLLTTNTNLSFTPGQTIIISYGSSNYMLATVTSYVSNTGQLNYTVPTTPGSVVGSGTYNAWAINLAGPVGTQGSQGYQGNQGYQGYQGNQGNQGTNGSTYFGVSTTVLTLQTGAGLLTTNTNLSFTPGQTVAIAYGSSTYMLATVTGYVSNTGQMNFTVPTTPGSVVGSGTYNAWSVNVAGPVGAQGVQGYQGYQGNQGNSGSAGSNYVGVSTTVLTLQTGTGTLTTNTNLSFTPGQTVVIAYGSTFYMVATVTFYLNSTGQMNFTVLTTPGSVVGSGTYNAWSINLAGAVGVQGNQGTQGNTGTGSQGPQGYQGYQGNTGAGVQGPQGYQGYQGSGVAGSPAGRMYHNVTQTIAANTLASQVTVTMISNFNYGGMTNGTNSLIVPTAGYYQVSAALSLTAIVAGSIATRFIASVFSNSTEVLRCELPITTTGSYPSFTMSGVIYCAANDALTLRGGISSGVTAPTVSTGNAITFLTAVLAST